MSSPVDAPVTLSVECRDPATRDRTYTLTIADAALHKANLDPLDRDLLRDCQGIDATIADKLLALEMLVRRIEQAL